MFKKQLKIQKEKKNHKNQSKFEKKKFKENILNVKFERNCQNFEKNNKILKNYKKI